MKKNALLYGIGAFLLLSTIPPLSFSNFQKNGHIFAASPKESQFPNAKDVLKLFFPQDSIIIADKTGETYIKHKGTNIESFINFLPETKELWRTRVLMIVPDKKNSPQFFILTETFHPNRDSHVCNAVLGFGMVRLSGDTLKIKLPHQYSGAIGTFGRFLKRENLSVLTLGSKSLGILIQDKDMHHGFISCTLTLYEITEQKLIKVFSGFIEPKSVLGCIDPIPDQQEGHSTCVHRRLFLTVDSTHISEGYYDLLLFVDTLRYLPHKLVVKGFDNDALRWERHGNRYTTKQLFQRCGFTDTSGK